jgi:hypothetical protein
MQQHKERAAASAALRCKGLPRHNGRNEFPSLEPQATTNTKSVSSSLSDMFKVVATTLQQADHGAESQEESIMAVGLMISLT